MTTSIEYKTQRDALWAAIIGGAATPVFAEYGARYRYALAHQDDEPLENLDD